MIAIFLSIKRKVQEQFSSKVIKPQKIKRTRENVQIPDEEAKSSVTYATQVYEVFKYISVRIITWRGIIPTTLR